MAISIGSFAIGDDGTGTTDTDRFFNATDKSTEISWSANDTIVAITGSENQNAFDLGTPTGTGLTFTEQTKYDFSTANESAIGLYTDKPTGSGSNVTVTHTPAENSGGRSFCLLLWVISGDVDSFTVLTADTSESDWNQTVAAGDIVIFAFMDWQATSPDTGKTPETASGTVTERVDVGDGSTYAIWAADWDSDNSAGTYDYGANNYTSLRIVRTAIVLTPAAATAGGIVVPPRRLHRARLQGVR